MSLKSIFLQFKIKISFTFLVVLLEGVLMILFPLFLGNAIESGLNQEFSGIAKLGILSIGVLLIGALRRFYDTRVYAGIYCKLSENISSRSSANGTSEKVAHINLLNEVVDFFENSIPTLLANLISLLGTLTIVFTLNFYVFIGCIICMLVLISIYYLTSAKTLRFNNNFNNQYEKQIAIHNQNKSKAIKAYYSNLMKWKIKLSDIETINFSGVWFILSILLCFSIYIVVGVDGLVFGTVFSLVMYVFQFMENSMNLPFYYQQTLRLKDISARINNTLI